jgi:hypothetical protein
MAATPSQLRPRRVYGACTSCGRTREQAGHISWRGLCPPCAEANVAANVEEIASRSGPAYDKWLAGIARFAESRAS